MVVFFDDDCECPHSSYFQTVVGAHLAHPETCAIAALKRLTRRDSAASPKPIRRWPNIGLRPCVTPDGEQLQLIGGCVSYKPEMLRASGLTFDPAIEFGGTETDLHERMHLAGLRLRMDPALNNIHSSRRELDLFLTQIVSARRRTNATLAESGESSYAGSYTCAAPKRHGAPFFTTSSSNPESIVMSGQSGYRFPTGKQIFAKIAREAPGFYLRHFKLDRESWYWRWLQLGENIYADQSRVLERLHRLRPRQNRSG